MGVTINPEGIRGPYAINVLGLALPQALWGLGFGVLGLALPQALWGLGFWVWPCPKRYGVWGFGFGPAPSVMSAAVTNHPSLYDRLMNCTFRHWIKIYFPSQSLFSRLRSQLAAHGIPPLTSDPLQTLKSPPLLNSYRAHVRSVTGVVYVDHKQTIITSSGDNNVRLSTR